MALDNIYADVTSTSYVSAPFDALGEMYAPMLRALLPTGRAWKFEDDSDFYSLLRAMSYQFYRVYLRGQDLLREFDPTTMIELIPDWERVLGLPGDNPTPPTTVAGRRAAIHGKLLGNDDPTATFFTELADGVGYTVIVKHREYSPFVAGSPVGDALTNNTSGGWSFYWRVIAIHGDNDDLLEWTIANLTPLHTQGDVVWLGDEWYQQDPPNVNLALWGVTSDGEGNYVAVGQADATDALILASYDGSTWGERSNPKAKILYSVAFGGDLFVAVGVADGTDAYIVTSPDGITWTERSNPKNRTLATIAHDGTQFVACGSLDGTDAYIITSPDGINWTERANPKNKNIYGIAHNGSDLFVAVGMFDFGAGADAYLITSPDGINWTERDNPKNTDLKSVAYDATLGLWAAVGSADGTDAYIITSPDGINWTEQDNPKNIDLYSVCATFGMFVATGALDGTDAYIVTSTDGVTWSEQSNPKHMHLRACVYDNGTVLAVGSPIGGDPYIVTSGAP